MVFTLGLRHTFLVWSRGLALVQSLWFRHRSLRSGRCRKNLPLCELVTSAMSVQLLLRYTILLSLGCVGCESGSSQTAVTGGQSVRNPLPVRYEYLVCVEQETRVTWVNGVWAGTKKGEIPAPQEFQTCPHTWEFLNEKGEEGWELVSVAPVTRTVDDIVHESEKLYLRRPVP